MYIYFFLSILLLMSSCRNENENTPKECAQLPMIANGKWNEQAPIYSGDSISSSCDVGYYGTSSPTAICNDGSWSAISGSCDLIPKKDCMYLPLITNGKWNHLPPIHSGDSIGSSCDVGYYGASSPMATCNDGSWSAISGSCDLLPKKDCMYLPLITNGKWNHLPPIRSGDSISSSCNAGYNGAPSPTSTCNDGSWSAISGSCDLIPKKDCTHLPSIANGKWNHLPPIHSGGIIRSSCDLGYHGAPSPTSICNDGSWSAISGSCDLIPKKDCTHLPSITNGKWNELPPIPSGDQISSTCDFGYKGKPSPIATCNDGSWINTLGSCVPRCPSGEVWDKKLNACLKLTSKFGFASTTCAGNGPNWNWDVHKSKCIYNGTTPFFVMFSGFIGKDGSRKETARKVFKAQHQYALKHGYAFFTFDGYPLTGKDAECKSHSGYISCLPYWAKVAQIKQFFESVEGSHLWFVWVDDDMVPLTQAYKLETILAESAGAHTSIIISDDADSSHNVRNPVNTGFFMVNASLTSYHLVETWYAMRDTYNGSQFLGSCLNQSCLHEQEALGMIYKDNKTIGSIQSRNIINIVSQKGTMSVPGINRFKRSSHWDIGRSMDLIYADPPKSVCIPTNDFLCQCTGMATDGYLHGEPFSQRRDLRSECLEQLISNVH